jgi:hypothetical protein
MEDTRALKEPGSQRALDFTETVTMNTITSAANVERSSLGIPVEPGRIVQGRGNCQRAPVGRTSASHNGRVATLPSYRGWQVVDHTPETELA